MKFAMPASLLASLLLAAFSAQSFAATSVDDVAKISVLNLKSLEQVGDFSLTNGGKVLLHTTANSVKHLCKLSLKVDGTLLPYKYTVDFPAGKDSKELQILSIQQYVAPGKDHFLEISTDPSEIQCAGKVKTALKTSPALKNDIKIIPVVTPTPISAGQTSNR